jgi:hypothetical protein
MARKAKDTPHLRLRVEPSLLARLEKAAERNERTLTGEIVQRLENSFKKEDLEAMLERQGRLTAEFILDTLASGKVDPAASAKLVQKILKKE